MSITYKQFVEGSKSSSLRLFDKLFNSAYKAGLPYLHPTGVIHYCTTDGENKFILGPLPNTSKDMERISDFLFDIHDPSKIRYVSFSTIGVVDPRESEEPSLVCLSMDREIWDFYAAPIEFTNDDEEEEDNFNLDRTMGIMPSSNRDGNNMNINLIGDWEKVGGIGKSYSDIAEIFMAKLR